jgi:hypothetical protein
MRRFLIAAIAGAAVLVPTAQAVPAFDVGGTELSNATGIPYSTQGSAAIPYLSHGQGVTADDVAGALASQQEQQAFQASKAPLRVDGPDGSVASAPTLRRDAPDGYVAKPYVTGTQQPSSPVVADAGWNIDWTALGIGAGMGFLLAALLAGAARFAHRGGIAKA